jgi:hypothetical protein
MRRVCALHGGAGARIHHGQSPTTFLVDASVPGVTSSRRSARWAAVPGGQSEPVFRVRRVGEGHGYARADLEVEGSREQVIRMIR